MSSRVKLPKANPQAELDAEACRAFELAAEGRNHATMQKPETTQELYLPTKISRLYISPTIRANPDCIEIATQQPGATKFHYQWSSCWSKERLAHDETVTIPSVQNDTEKTVNKHGRPGSRIPGIFVANDEIEEPLLVIWTTAEGKKTTILIKRVYKVGNQETYKTEVDGYVMVSMC